MTQANNAHREYNATALKVCTWLGPIFCVMFLVGAVPMAGVFPPPSAADTAEMTTDFFVNELSGARLGCLVMIMSAALFAPWGLTIAYATSRSERGFPILFYTQVVSVALGTIIILLIPLFWGIAAFRPGEAGVDITQTWNDAAWFAVLFTWPPFTVWCFAIGFAVLGDKEAEPLLPRWIGYINLWTGVLYAPAGMMIFFKTGVFAQDGLITFWIPVGVFFLWALVMSWAVLRAIKKDSARKTPQAQTAAAGAA